MESKTLHMKVPELPGKFSFIGNSDGGQSGSDLRDWEKVERSEDLA